MEDRRISKRKIKRPSYLDHFHIDDARESRGTEEGNKSSENQKSLVQEQRPVKIKPISASRETKRRSEGRPSIDRNVSVTSNISQGNSFDRLVSLSCGFIKS